MRPQRSFTTIAALAISVMATAWSPATASAAVPGQFVAKLYTEALGRAPDPEGWRNAMPYFEQNTCSQSVLAEWGQSLFDSPEYAGLAYDNAAHLLVAYRAILNREPDTNGYNQWLQALDNGTSSRAGVVEAMFNSSEFGSLSSKICAGGTYSFGTQPVMRVPMPASGGYDFKTGQDLQALIDKSAPGTVIALRQRSVIVIDKTLQIRNGITLATAGSPDSRHHANMARLVRGNQADGKPFNSALIGLAFGSATHSGTLRNVWVDGQRNSGSAWTLNAINVEIRGGKGVVVKDNFISNTLGWTGIQARGSFDKFPCSSLRITNNVITSYSARHYESGKYTDGLSIGCEGATITGNAVIDATDVGIAVFPAATVPQKSVIESNTILSAGNSAFAALGYDGYLKPDGSQITTSDFKGARLSKNTLWTSPNTHFIIGLSVGSKAWWGGTGLNGDGGAASGNTSAKIPTNVAIAVGVSGMLNASVLDNSIVANLMPDSDTLCPSGNVVASVKAGYASGSIQPYADQTISGCISDFAAHPPEY
ncbi:DUF4214 domain-containing protein [Ideonella sp. DXS29W]|uniref:DUF4214 domain-containing protein n=1 Tax=Ideonella lacteola TaxID=2984193 RepID=A0ABU9C0S4_9BURK